MWRTLFSELWHRASEPLFHPAFFIYFVVIVVFVGGLGAWIPLFQLTVFPQSGETLALVYSAIATSSLAFIASAAVDIILSANLVDDSSGKPSRHLLVFAVCVVFIGVITAFTGIVLSFSHEAETLSGRLSLASYVLALFLWWIANSDNAMLVTKDPNPNVTTGGGIADSIPGRRPDEIKFE